VEELLRDGEGEVEACHGGRPAVDERLRKLRGSPAGLTRMRQQARVHPLRPDGVLTSAETGGGERDRFLPLARCVASAAEVHADDEIGFHPTGAFARLAASPSLESRSNRRAGADSHSVTGSSAWPPAGGRRSAPRYRSCASSLEWRPPV